MLFNSIDFAIFLPIVFFIYWFVLNKTIKIQNIFIVIASYTFYSFWNWKFLALIFLSTFTDYCVGLALDNEENKTKRKIFLGISLIVNLGILGFFKYYNFFIDNFIKIFSFFGQEIKPSSLNVILPVGISFYTFQTMSYSIDVYNKKIKPCRDFFAFASFVSFFPQLVAGPIERAKNLLPQFIKKREFNYEKSVDGMRQILWGLFKKIVIADNCAEFVDLIFNNSSNLSGSTLALGAMLFAFQIYGDFSGYSDIAIGTARLFGINIMRNFNYPYFSRDIAEFWRRWHISLTSWFKDYLYIPLGGSRCNIWLKIRNTFAIFLVSGFWHGANWKFIAWGAINAIYFLPLLLTNKNRKNLDTIAKTRILPAPKELIQMLVTFCLTVFAWIFFRANNIDHGLSIISKIFSLSFFTIPNFDGREKALELIIIICIFIAIEWLGREEQYAIARLENKLTKPLRYLFYYAIIATIFFFGGIEQQFIYFQF
jgi:D-alanyl-lipoteichoic acid acyltransferase DltB (MBOAT superfamily)